jgi:hypothetical protein
MLEGFDARWSEEKDPTHAAYEGRTRVGHARPMWPMGSEPAAVVMAVRTDNLTR